MRSRAVETARQAYGRLTTYPPLDIFSIILKKVVVVNLVERAMIAHIT
jgi:hypothetical protein